MYEGICRGGPLDGQTVVCRNPEGFLCADKPAGRAWIYDLVGDEFHVREPEPRQFDPARAINAAFSDGFDVIAAPEGVGGDGS